jgi:hypothetical protein
MGGHWYRLLKTNAECGCKYGDDGLWATIVCSDHGRAESIAARVDPGVEVVPGA